MGKYLRTANPDALAESYDIDVQKYMLRVPLTTTEAMKSVLDDLGRKNSQSQGRRPERDSSTTPSCDKCSRAVSSTPSIE